MYHSWARSGEKIAETAQTDTRAASASAALQGVVYRDLQAAK